MFNINNLGITKNIAFSHFQLSNRGRKDGMASSLIIRQTVESDYDKYNCTVRNSHGADSFIISLKRESKLDLYLMNCKI